MVTLIHSSVFLAAAISRWKSRFKMPTVLTNVGAGAESCYHGCYSSSKPALHRTTHISQELPVCLHIHSKVNLQTVLKQGRVGVLEGTLYLR